MKRKAWPHASHYTDRHGVRRWRYRHKGRSAELGKTYGSDDFKRRYEAAENGRVAGVGTDRTVPGTMDALIVSFYKSPDFKKLSPATATNYRHKIERIRKAHGTKRVAMVRRRHVMDMMAAKAETPNAANFVLRMMRQLLAHAVDLEMIEVNPARDIKRFTVGGDGFHTWSEAEIAAFYATHPHGTVAHIAMTLMLYTGAARSDAVCLGWGNLDAGRISYKRMKTGQRVDIPVHPDLAVVLDDLPRDAFTFLQTSKGRSRSGNGLGNQMRKWCDTAGLPDCTSHGLRKACATRLADAGATPHQIAAVTGHKTLSEVERYTRAADKASLADSAMGMIPARSKGEQKLTNHPTRFVKKTRK